MKKNHQDYKLCVIKNKIEIKIRQDPKLRERHNANITYDLKVDFFFCVGGSWHKKTTIKDNLENTRCNLLSSLSLSRLELLINMDQVVVVPDVMNK